MLKPEISMYALNIIRIFEKLIDKEAEKEKEKKKPALRACLI
jgi:hypothetical protein